MEIDVFERKTEENRAGTSLKEKASHIVQKINYVKIMGFVATFLVSRVSVFGGIMPFGVAMFAAGTTTKFSYLTIASVIISTFLNGYNVYSVIKYAVAIALFCTVAQNMGNVFLKTTVRKGILMAASTVLANIFINIGGGFLLYDYFIMLLEAIIIFTSVYMFSSALKTLIIAGADGDVGEASVLPVAMLASVTVLGCEGIFDVWGISISGILCIVIALFFAHGGGVLAGAGAGVIIGLIAGFSEGNSSSVLGAFAFSAMVAGYFSVYGRSATVLSFILANSVITFYTNDSAEILINIYEIFIASAIFLILPKNAFSYFEMKSGGKNYSAKVKGFIDNELSAVSAAFQSLGETFRQISEDKNILSTGATSELFERTARKVCDGCALREHCWRKEFHRTYTAFFVMLEICEKKGRVLKVDMPETLKSKCRKTEHILAVFNNTYEIYRVDKLWESRVSEGRAMIYRHFQSIAGRVNKMAKEIKKGTVFDYEAEGLIAVALSENKMPVKEVTVISRQKNGKAVHIKFKENIALDREKVRDAVGKVLGEEMRIVFESERVLRLESTAALSVSVGAATVLKEQSRQSGDSFGHMSLENGKFMLALSDGMGSGARAAGDSRATVNIIKKLLGAGFDANTAISLVNSVLVLKSAETRFATVDLALLDFIRAEVKFYKAGAATSYIKRGDEVCVIENKAMPAGVSKKADIECKKIKICGGDIIVLMSDGVCDADRMNANEKWILDILSDYKGTSPDELAGKIIENAKRKSCGMIRDDMSVVVARINEA